MLTQTLAHKFTSIALRSQDLSVVAVFLQMKLLEVKRASAREKLLVVMGVGNVEIVVVIHVEDQP